MATQQDIQDILRILRRRNVPMLTAMGQIKSLQAANLRSIQQIAESPLDCITKALGDAKMAKSLHTASKQHIRDTSTPAPLGKRHITDGASPSDQKRVRLDPGEQSANLTQSPSDIEEALALPVATEERAITSRRVYTNRAPVLLAFATELLRFTMPEQPNSSRLSLAQAVVSLNAKSKAVSLGLEKDWRPQHSSWEAGQPKVSIMGREVPILRRDGYEWPPNPKPEKTLVISGPSPARQEEITPSTWVVSQPVTSRGSTFVARAVHVSNPADGPRLVEALVAADPTLKTATHNSWGLRIRRGGAFFDNNAKYDVSNDDGETGCGAFILRLLEEAQADNTMVLITRWFGGTMLGPDRWKLMRGRVLEALSERLRSLGQRGHDRKVAIWGLDVDDVNRSGRQDVINTSWGGLGRGWDQHSPGMPIYNPESARRYLHKSFLSGPPSSDLQGPSKVKDTTSTRETLLRSNLALVLGAIRLLFTSWAPHLTVEQLDRRAWDWYIAVRPDVETGPSGWGAKGWLDLDGILALRRETTTEAAI